MSIKAIIIFFTIILVAMASPPRLLSRSGSSPALRIVGGRPGSIKGLPYQANILLHGQHFCGGSIITPNLILTAGHCVCQQPASALKVVTGSSFSGNGIMSDIGHIFCHEQYDKNEGGLPRNDIAILKLNIPLSFTDLQNAIPTYRNSEIIYFNEMGLVSGWGKTEEESSSYVLKTTEVPVVDMEECRRIYGKIKGQLPEGTFCAGWLKFGGHDSCQGDSGGPLVINQKLAGVVSAGLECGAANAPGVYTSVKYFEGWIERIKAMVKKEEDEKKGQRLGSGHKSLHNGHNYAVEGQNFAGDPDEERPFLDNMGPKDNNNLQNDFNNGENHGYRPNDVGRRLDSNNNNQMDRNDLNIGGNQGYGMNNMGQRPGNNHNQMNYNLNNGQNGLNDNHYQAENQGYDSSMGQNVNNYHVVQQGYQPNQMQQNTNNYQYDQYRGLTSQNGQCETCNTGYYTNGYYQQAYNPYQQLYRQSYYPGYYGYYG